MISFRNPFFVSHDKKVEEKYQAGVKALSEKDYYVANNLFKIASHDNHVSAFFNENGGILRP